jgi:hypothetical protein
LHVVEGHVSTVEHERLEIEAFGRIRSRLGRGLGRPRTRDLGGTASTIDVGRAIADAVMQPATS